MSEEQSIQPHVLKNTKDNLALIYLTFGAGSLTLGATTIFGVIWAFLEREKVDENLSTHIKFIIHTFWKSWLFLIIGGLTSFFIVGFLVLIFWFFWLIVRSYKGFQALRKGEAIAKPKRWLF